MLNDAVAQGDEDDWANALTPAELDAYLRAWKALYPMHVPLITTLVLTGLRWGEVCFASGTPPTACASTTLRSEPTKPVESAHASCPSYPRSQREVVDQPHTRFRRACHDTRNLRNLLVLL